MPLFWHGLFATAYSKTNNSRSILNQFEMFRRVGLGLASRTSCWSSPATPR